MSEDAQPSPCLVLSREPAGEHFTKLALFGAQTGVVPCLLRTSSRSKTRTADTPDLFDTAEVRLDAPKGAGPLFVAEYRVTHRRAGLGADYIRLALACRLALTVTKNPLPEDSTEAVFALCEKSLTAFDVRPRPDATLFKAFWQLAKGEGFPVREQWQASLPPAKREQATLVLAQALDAQTVPAADVAHLTQLLEHWMHDSCQFVMPPR